MSNILIVSQKELIANPIFRQDKNLVETYNLVKENNNVKILYLHRNLNLDKEVKNEVVKEIQETKRIDFDIEQFCIRDMIRSISFKKKLINFFEEHKIQTVIFMSYHMAKLVIPYVENIIDKFNIICDFRLSNLSYFLQQYKDEKEKSYPKFQNIYKNFKMHFLQSIAIIKNSDYLLFDEDCDCELLEKEDIKNIFYPKDIKKLIGKKNIFGRKNKNELNVTCISINRNNYAAKNTYGIVKNNNEYTVNETKYFNLIDDINDIIINNKSEYFCISSSKINLLSNSLNYLTQYLDFNKNAAAASPTIIYSREIDSLKVQFENQRNNNFSLWEENSSPLLFSDCIVIKKNFFNKVGLFDNRFKTFDYALFDFILRVHQIKAYYFTMRDVSAFKNMAVSRQISLFKQDKVYLCSKWGESLFNMGI